MDDLYVAQFARSRHQGIQQYRWRGAIGMNPYTVAGADRLQRLRGVYALVPILFAPVHVSFTPYSRSHRTFILFPLLLPLAAYQHLSLALSLSKSLRLPLQMCLPKTQIILCFAKIRGCDECHYPITH
jgi:hypothetical protein